DSGGDGNRTFEAYRQDLPRGDHESPGCIKRERIVASKKVAPRAEPTSEGRRQHEQPNTDRYGCSPWRGFPILRIILRIAYISVLSTVLTQYFTDNNYSKRDAISVISLQIAVLGPPFFFGYAIAASVRDIMFEIFY